MAKFLATCSERNEPEILVLEFAHAEVSIALVVIKIYGEFVDEAEDLVLAVAEGDGEVVADLLGPDPFASVGRFWVGGESNRDNVVVVGANVRLLAAGELDAVGAAGGVASSEGVDQQGGHGVSPRLGWRSRPRRLRGHR